MTDDHFSYLPRVGNKILFFFRENLNQVNVTYILITKLTHFEVFLIFFP